MTREEWERRLYDKLAGFVIDALHARNGPMLARWLATMSDDLKSTLTAAWATAQPPLPTDANGSKPGVKHDARK